MIRLFSWLGRSRFISAALALAALAASGCSQGADPADSAEVTLGPRSSFRGLSFAVPAAWVPRPPSSGMRRAQYRLPAVAPDAQDGECALFHFPGQGGSVQANLDRWYGQFQQPDRGSTARRARVETFEASGLPVTLVQVNGTYVASMGPLSSGDPKPGYAMVAGVVETTAGPWFLKCVGLEATIRSAAPSVRALLKTVQP